MGRPPIHDGTVSTRLRLDGDLLGALTEMAADADPPRPLSRLVNELLGLALCCRDGDCVNVDRLALQITRLKELNTSLLNEADQLRVRTRPAPPVHVPDAGVAPW